MSQITTLALALTLTSCYSGMTYAAQATQEKQLIRVSSKSLAKAIKNHNAALVHAILEAKPTLAEKLLTIESGRKVSPLAWAILSKKKQAKNNDLGNVIIVDLLNRGVKLYSQGMDDMYSPTNIAKQNNDDIALCLIKQYRERYLRAVRGKIIL